MNVFSIVCFVSAIGKRIIWKFMKNLLDVHLRNLCEFNFIFASLGVDSFFLFFLFLFFLFVCGRVRG